MARPRVYRAEGIVLRQQRLGEADRIITVYTADRGKLRLAARGVRKTRSRMAGHLEPLTRVDLLLAEGRNLDVVSQTQTVDAYLPIRSDLWRMTCGLYLAELVDRMTEEADLAENRELYTLLAGCLHWLTVARSGDLVMRYFELHLLNHAGFRPQLTSCARCNRTLTEHDRRFSSAEGGLICLSCNAGGVRDVSLAAVKVLRFLSQASIVEADRLAIESAVHAELEAVISGYLRHVLDREVRSRSFVDTVRRSEALLTLPVAD